MAKTPTVVATKKPTGMSITRNGNVFTFSWKIGDSDYDEGQMFYWNLNNKRQWGPQKIGVKTTTYVTRIDLSNTDCRTIRFAVQGNKKKQNNSNPGWSGYQVKDYTMKPPAMPIITYTLDSDNAYCGTFSWEIPYVNTTNDRHFRKFEWESILVSKWNSTDPPTKWTAEDSADGQILKSTGTTTTGSKLIKENSVQWNNIDASYSRWFRVRSHGAGGISAWRYLCHVYALPRVSENVTAVATPTSGDSGYTITARWTAPESIPYPIETDLIMYAIVKPRTAVTKSGDTMVTTMDYPVESPSWTQAGTIRDTDYEDAMTFSIPEVLSDDECIFVKIDTKHDSFVTSGIPVLVENGVGNLPDPVVTSITSNPSTHRITVSARNASDLEASFLAVYYRTEDTPDSYQTIGILKHSEQQETFQCPDWGNKGFSIGIQAFIADYSPAEKASSGVTNYTLTNVRMTSDIVWDEGPVPKPPKSIELLPINSTTIRVLWDWTWTEANKAEISWADHADAWESTDGPNTYEVTNVHTGAWNIAGLSVGTWYVRVRLIREQEDSTVYGLYSDAKSIKLSSAPAIPSLVLSSGVVAEDGEVTCYWAYTSTDGTVQMQADICEATYDAITEKYTYGEIIDKTASAQHITLPIQRLGWHAGEVHYLAVRVISASGEQSLGWSAPVPVRVADPLTVIFDNTSLVNKTIVLDEDASVTELSLTELPLSFTIDSKGACDSINVVIERSEDYHMDRPNESNFDGYEGETVVTKTFNGDGEYTIEVDDLIGYLDDNAKYRLIATGKDTYGQAATSEPIEFTVHWDHQAVVPSAQCEMDNQHYASILTPLLPDGYEKQPGDVCDIYRLSIDAPELIYENAEFGSTYVDPYPTIGDMGGHRFVFKTANGDYTTEDNTIAWYDTRNNENDFLDIFTVLIDYNGEQVSLPFNVQLSNRWAKDFQQTNYLGGSTQGDWNPAVNRTGSVTTVGIVTDEFGDEELDGTVESVRRLATYPGICHVRTPDGSSYSANINVTEDREEKMINKLAKYSLEITAVDSQELDGVTYEVWQEMHQGEE